ncbi:hypothetical protein [Halomonas mongoliensis]|uniref:hypothetical protein n=1 Tax=Halomonas mongoliensis TaxID=321265 RepID=UPI00403A96BB
MQTEDGRYIPSQESFEQLLSERFMLAEKLIKEDIENGLFTAEEADSFESLHEVTDPNCYVSDEGEPASSMEKDLLKHYGTEDWNNYWQILIDALDSWLRCGMKGSVIDQLNDGILLKRF